MHSLYIAVLVLLVSQNKVLGACLAGWTNFQGSCYQFNTHSRRNWLDAAKECALAGSHLVYIDSSSEDRFVVEKLRPKIDISPSSDKRTAVWIGGTDDQQEGAWVWYGNDQPIIEYTNWYPGEPDTGDGDHEEDCISLVGNHGYLWQDHNCHEDMYYVCEQEEQGISVG